MITRIEAFRYRCFEQLSLLLKPYQLAVGPNGAGKTTLLDIPVVIGEMLTAHDCDKAFFGETATHPRPRADAARELLFNNQGDGFTLAVEAELPPDLTARILERRTTRRQARAVKGLRDSPDKWPAKMRYEVQFEVFNEALQIGQEYLLIFPRFSRRGPANTLGLLGESLPKASRAIIPVIQRPRGEKALLWPEGGRRTKSYDFAFRPNEPALGSLIADPGLFPASLWFRELLMERVCAYQPRLERLRLAQAAVRKITVVHDGATLPWLVTELGRTPRQFDHWLRMVRLALPSVKGIETVIRADDKHAYLRVTYQNGASVPSSGLSDGTLSILAVTILPFLSSGPAVLTHEEPENGIHPKGIEVVLEALKSIRASQVFVSSHSPLVLAQCEPADVVCLSLSESGAAVAVRGDDHPALTDWQASIDLGALFASGVLG